MTKPIVNDHATHRAFEIPLSSNVAAANATAKSIGSIRGNETFGTGVRLLNTNSMAGILESMLGNNAAAIAARLSTTTSMAGALEGILGKNITTIAAGVFASNSMANSIENMLGKNTAAMAAGALAANPMLSSIENMLGKNTASIAAGALTVTPMLSSFESILSNNARSIAERITALNIFLPRILGDELGLSLKDAQSNSGVLIDALEHFEFQDHFAALVASLEENHPDKDEEIHSEKYTLSSEHSDYDKSFYMALDKLPNALKKLLFSLICLIFLQIPINVVSNILAEKISEYLKENSNLSQREQRKYISLFPRDEIRDKLRNHRFVSKASVDFHIVPNSKSSILGSLVFSQIVEVLVVQGAWTKVQYEYEDGEIITGWVFTRYLEKFSR